MSAKMRKVGRPEAMRPEVVKAIHAAPPAVNPERLAAAKRRRRKLLLTWAIVLSALVLVGLIVYQLLPKEPAGDSFARCLTEKGAVMYGTDLCSHCQDQKRLFGSTFAAVTFVNCDYSAACKEKNVSRIPTWIFADGTRLEGKQPLERLAEMTGCRLSY